MPMSNRISSWVFGVDTDEMLSRFTVTVYYRHVIVPHLPSRIRSLFPSHLHYQPLTTFAEQAGQGLSSSAFDIEANIRNGDSRAGLDEQGVREVQEIMRRERVK